ncbi:MAG TPA: Rho termination factor N-terminal domain-containing protein, partial [Streptosporangiaceae bacterium]|nr:Rho termination factor N-terminal domain-containing protein [Streptosporangiaceae bacterium]
MSDTTELLSSAPGASEGAPVGTSAPSAADPSVADGASTPKSRSRGGTGLSSLLMPELQRIAQSMSIPGAGRMRKGQLIEAIEARQGGAPKQEAGAANQGSNQRAASAGADATRGIGADGATGTGQQLSFDQAPATDRPNGRSRRTATQRTATQRASAQQAPAQDAPAQQASGEQAPAPQAAAAPDQAQHAAAQESAAAPQGAREDGQTGPRDEAATGETQRGDRRRRNVRREDQPSRS